MTTRILLRTLLSSVHQTLTPTRSFTTTSHFLRLRPLAVAAANLRQYSLTAANNVRTFSTRPTTSSLNDSNPNWSNRPPKETILLDGCDFEHWLVVVEKPEGEPTRDEIIESYINTLAKVVGSYDEARMKIYSVSTRCYFAFGALVSEELSYKLKELPGVRWVLPDSYLDVKNKDYGGEPFIDGKAVPYDPKYHEEWIRNNARANERNRRNDRPRNFDRSRNFERRRENMQNNRGPPGPPPNNMSGPPPPNNMSVPPPLNNMSGPPPPNNWNGPPPPNIMSGPPPPNNWNGPPPQNNWNGPPQPNNWNGPPPPNNMRGPPPPNNYQQQGRYGPGPTPGQAQDVGGRDMPPAANYE
ncbi:multiple organellar RNA editing factor 8, chloroplastic/mitochondrial-like [Bidens hawaiensis]|uniref:multiple organellar RNA editing factor 8, chloroplastic/mitochondrial-like n=1 Tax=Bidens hawaiensis TaxID=980011 RepID=UPI00404B3EFB